jgi:hypothetical protein
MARVAASDITITIKDRGMVGKKRRVYGSLTFNSTTLTYTGTTGIPLPTFEKWGFLKQIDNVFFNQNVAATVGGYVYKFDPTNKSIRVYNSAAITPAGTISQPVFAGVAATPTGTVSAPTLGMASYTPAGTVSGTIAALVFTGTPATLTGTVSQPTFTGVAATPTGTVSAPVFTGTAVAAAGLSEWTDNVALGASITLYFDAIGV